MHTFREQFLLAYGAVHLILITAGIIGSLAVQTNDKFHRKPELFLLKRLIQLRQLQSKSAYETTTETEFIPESEDSHEFNTVEQSDLYTTSTTDSPSDDDIYLDGSSSIATSAATTALSEDFIEAQEGPIDGISVIEKIRNMLSSTLPRLKRMLDMKNQTLSYQHRDELLRLAAKIQPLLLPLAKVNTTFARQVDELGKGIAAYNRTGRGWGGCQSCCCGGGGGGGDNSLLPYLLANKNDNSLLQTLLPLLFGLIALLIMKLPT